MKNYTLFIILLLLLLLKPINDLCAQFNDLLLNNIDITDSLPVYSFSTSLMAGSNIASVKNTLNVLKDNHIDNENKNDILNSLKPENRLGEHHCFEALYFKPLNRYSDSVALHFLAGYSHHTFHELSLSKNAIKLALLGNTPFMGDTLNTASALYQKYKYQQLKFGLMKTTKTERGDFLAGFALGINLGLEHTLADLDHSWLFTAPYAENISFYSDMNFRRSKPGNVSPFNVKGIGPALDLFFSWKPHNGPAISVSFSQLGFITWNKSSNAYRRDTVITFSGIYIDNIFNIENSAIEKVSLDTIEELFLSYGGERRYYSALPLTFHLSVAQNLNNLPLRARLEFLYRHDTEMKPYISGAIDWQVNKDLIISQTHAYGGYQRYSAGLSLIGRILPNVIIYAGSNSVYPTINSNKKLSLHLNAGIIIGSRSALFDPLQTNRKNNDL